MCFVDNIGVTDSKKTDVVKAVQRDAGRITVVKICTIKADRLFALNFLETL